MCVDGKGELWESALSSASEEFKGSDSDPQAWHRSDCSFHTHILGIIQGHMFPAPENTFTTTI